MSMKVSADGCTVAQYGYTKIVVYATLPRCGRQLDGCAVIGKAVVGVAALIFRLPVCNSLLL